MNLSTPARTLARGRINQNRLIIALAASGIFNIAVPVYFSIEAKHKDEVVVFDLSSGTLLLSPLVDPASAKEVLDISSSWAAKCILDRSPAGLENEALLGILFNSETARKVRDEFSSVKMQYAQKNLRAHVEIKNIDAQQVANGIIRSRVTGQVVVTGTLNGESIQEVQPVVLDISLARNPDLGRNQRYPLMCFSYAYADSSLAKK